MKIFTSYHAKAKALIELGIKPISISVQFPKYSTIKYNEYGILAPRYYMLKMSQEAYDIEFEKILSKLNAKEVYNDLKNLAQNKDIALLCYEANHNECHRKKVGEWLEGNLKIQIKEYIFEKKQLTKNPSNQINLF